jgi:hypothetical protein
VHVASLKQPQQLQEEEEEEEELFHAAKSHVQSVELADRRRQQK